MSTETETVTYCNEFDQYKTEFVVHNDRQKTCFVHLKGFSEIPVMGNIVSIRLVIPYSNELSPRLYRSAVDSIIQGLEDFVPTEPYPWELGEDYAASMWRMAADSESLLFIPPQLARETNGKGYQVAIMLAPKWKRPRDLTHKEWITSLIEMIRLHRNWILNIVKSLRNGPY
jgi:hypothetical protein